MSSIKDVQQRLDEKFGIQVKTYRLAHIMKHQMGMKYKRVKEISYQANSIRNLVLRQQFALTFLKLNLYGKIIINIDETWLGMTDFRKMKWKFMDRPDSIKKKQLQPRISMITGLESTGKVFISLLQANSNSSVMEMFLIRLLEQLDRERKDWRTYTLLMMDGAPYHMSAAMMAFYKQNRVPIIFTGPHSYDASPIELFFAAFKSKDINPNNLPTGKR